MPALPSLSMLLLVWAFAGPLLAYGFTKADALFERRAAVRDARLDEQTQCKQRIENIKTEINNAAQKRVEDAEAAARSVGPAPADAAGLRRLCNADMACRDRVR